MIKTVLTIAGSDPTGGAGIQADLKTMTAIGVYGAAVITCVTVQNSRGVSRIEPLHPELVAEQIEAVLTDHRVTHVKIGMIGTAAIARAIARKLRNFKGEVIFDPVLHSSTGHPLLPPDDLESVRADLLALTTVLTPNLPELEVLSETAVQGNGEVRAGVDALMQKYSSLRAILVKGGHGDSTDLLTDCLFFADNGKIERETLSHPFLQTCNSHGTGCTLASAFASYHALGGDYSSAFLQAVFFVQELLKESASLKIVTNPKGKGGLLHHLACAAMAE
ncbi:MAG: bifunctional hydroxymethylpyrimidine kinase/phosphomethylpyrimidine kinase [Desulfobulbus sp.]|nr:MAG: bifunctional hydroxymethylpyrimidine kinase/phosphomethylpyrimidine kinase [Desulfobulbus sp.]